MQAVTTIGLDIAKSVFQVHGIDMCGYVSVRRRLKRHYVPTPAHRWRRPPTWTLDPPGHIDLVIKVRERSDGVQALQA